MDGKQGFNLLAIILTILLLLIGGWGYWQNSSKRTLKVENERLEKELEDLNDLKEDIASDVDSLENKLAVLTEENATLQNSLDDAASQIARKNAAVKANEQKVVASAKEINNLRAEIQGLLESKEELEISIEELQFENDSLKTLAGVLKKDLTKARKDNQELANMNRAMEEELQRLTLSNFKATAFQVEIERRKPKVTSKSKLARRILVTFDLTNVPEEFHGVRPIYMAITDRNGNPIKTQNPVQATISVQNQTMELIAVKSQNVNVTNSQRLSFKHDIDPRLSEGYYRVSTYTDIGLLGSSTFRLR